MNGDELRAVLLRAFDRLPASKDELRELDSAVGDGDLGITVSAGARAATEAMQALPGGATPHAVLVACAGAIASANPSTFAALAAAGTLAGAKEIAELAELSGSDLVRFGRAAAAAIAKRGKSELGDKTVLDAVVPSVDALEAAFPDRGERLEAAIEAARNGIEQTSGQASRKGRAAWAGERGVGTPDAGATAYLRFLEALRAETTTRTGK